MQHPKNEKTIHILLIIRLLRGCCKKVRKTGTVPELLKNAFEATQFYFEDQFKVSYDNLKFEIDFAQFFKYYKVINAKFLAEKIGMNPTLLSQYVQGHKKPSESQTEKIISGIQQIGQELSEINLIYKR